MSRRRRGGVTVSRSGQRRHHLLPLVLLEPPVARQVGEPPLVVLHDGEPLQQPEPGVGRRLEDHLVHRAVGVVLEERERAVLVGAGEGRHLVQIGVEVDPDQLTDHVVGERLAPGQQREAGGEAAQVPADVPEIGLVEVVDVEDDAAGAVHVGAEVLRVQVTLDPHPGRPFVAPLVFHGRHVGIEQARAAPVERERIGGHLPELGAERVRVGRHEIGEGLDQYLDDELRALVELGVLCHTYEGVDHGEHRKPPITCISQDRAGEEIGTRGRP